MCRMLGCHSKAKPCLRAGRGFRAAPQPFWQPPAILPPGAVSASRHGRPRCAEGRCGHGGMGNRPGGAGGTGLSPGPEGLCPEGLQLPVWLEAPTMLFWVLFSLLCRIRGGSCSPANLAELG